MSFKDIDPIEIRGSEKGCNIGISLMNTFEAVFYVFTPLDIHQRNLLRMNILSVCFGILISSLANWFHVQQVASLSRCSYLVQTGSGEVGEAGFRPICLQSMVNEK